MLNFKKQQYTTISKQQLKRGQYSDYFGVFMLDEIGDKQVPIKHHSWWN